METGQGHGLGSRFVFTDNLPGPGTLEIRPHEVEPQINELELCRQFDPKPDWETMFAELDEQHRSPNPPKP